MNFIIVELKKVRPQAQELLGNVRDSIGIKHILMTNKGSSWLKFGLFTVGLANYLFL